MERCDEYIARDEGPNGFPFDGARAPQVAAEPMFFRDGIVPLMALEKALEFLEAGAWQKAHEIVQAEKSPLAAWLHGIVHTLEGDLDNARYWYRKADRAFPGPEAVQREIAAARRTLVDAV